MTADASHDWPACAIFRGGRCTCDQPATAMRAPVVIGYRVSSMTMKWTERGGRGGSGTTWRFEDRRRALARVRRICDQGLKAEIERIVIPEAL